MTTTAHAIKALDGSTTHIGINHSFADGQTGCDLEVVERWEELRSFAGQLMELIQEAEANADPEGVAASQ